jgi:hypothetical protein
MCDAYKMGKKVRGCIVPEFQVSGFMAGLITKK